MKSNKILVVGVAFLLWCMPMHSMNNGVKQKQGIGKTVLYSLCDLGCAGLGYVLGQKLFTTAPNVGYAAGAGLACVGLKYLYDYYSAIPEQYTPEQLLNLLLHNPKKALDYTYKINGRFCNSVPENGSLKKILDVIERYEKECPILFLGECTNEGWGACILSRAYNKKFRDSFEAKVVTAISEKLKTQKSVDYAGFGSGGRFQDLVIIAKTLAKNPTARINVNLIDPKYFYYMELRDQLKNTREVGANFDDTPNEQFLDYALEQAKKQVAGYSPDPKVFKKNVFENMALEGKKYREFILFLKKMFPKAQPSLLIHASTDAYLKYIEDNTLSYPDVITAADIQDEMSLIKQSTYDYGKLCFLSMQKKPSSTNLWLSKGVESQNPAIVTYSFKELAGASKQDLTGKLDYDKTIGQVWMSEQKI